jgi:signal transduction histidine kinase
MKAKNRLAGLSILTAQMISYLLVIAVVTVTSSLFFFSTARNHLEREIGARLRDIARISARNTPHERLALIEVGDDDSRMVRRLEEKLGEIREAAGVSRIAVFRPGFGLLLDPTSDDPIGTKRDPLRSDAGLAGRLARGEAVHTGGYRAGSGALLVSAFAPVRSPEGGLFAVVGVDAGMREVEVIERQRTRLFLVAGVALLLAVAVALVLARTLTRPISAMAAAAARLGEGDYDARVATPSTRELRALAGAMNRMAEQIQRRDGQLKEISASVAHEVRNPLNSIKLLLTLLEEDLRDGGARTPGESLAAIHREIGKLGRFLTEFLTYSRPLTLVRERVPLGELARSAAAMAAAEAGERGVAIAAAEGGEEPEALVDRDRMEQSLLNIVLNAVQASPEDGCVDIEVKWDRERGEAVIAVTDRGPGVPEEVRARLFEPFFTTRATGTGLGLANAHRVVSAHGGAIRVESRPGGGAVVSVVLPVAPPAPGEV